MKTENYDEERASLDFWVKERKFSYYCFPGGTEKIKKKFNSTVMLIDINEDKNKVSICAVPYRRNFRQEQEASDEISIIKETPKSLAVRKVKEETGIDVLEEDLVFVDKRDDPDNFNNKGVHTKYYYYALKFSGEFIDHDNTPSFLIETGTPYSVSAQILIEYLFYKQVWIFIKLIQLLHSQNLISKEAFSEIVTSLENKEFGLRAS